MANQVALALEASRQHEDLIHAEQVELGLELAGQVQRSILPAELPVVAGYEFFAHYSSAFLVGGDYYDFVRLPQADNDWRSRWATWRARACRRRCSWPSSAPTPAIAC